MISLEQVVILCGGKGTRLREETEFKPKPMVEIGGKPILWHIMKTYQHFGYEDFILCLGYKGNMIEEYFNEHMGKLNITFANTGLETQTGSRLAKIEKLITKENFLMTYGDGLSNVPLDKVRDFHEKQHTIATLTAVHPHTTFGRVIEDEGGIVREFDEKPVLHDYINGGFYFFNIAIFDYLTNGEECVLEKEPMKKLVSEKELSMFKHEGFWHAMDTYKDYLELNKMWETNPRWKV